jgi:hypothetical protein
MSPIFEYIFNFSGTICSPPDHPDTGIACTNTAVPGFPPPPPLQPFSVNFDVLSPKLTYTAGENFNSGILNAFDVNIVINGVPVEHDGTGTFELLGEFAHGSLSGGGFFDSSAISFGGGTEVLVLGPTTDALNGASMSWSFVHTRCFGSAVPGLPDFCQVEGASVVPEPGAAALAILGAAMLVAWRVLEKRYLRDHLRQYIGWGRLLLSAGKGPALLELDPPVRAP